MAAHAKFSPSASKQWATCPGSWGAQVGKDSESSPAAIEGTIAHEFAEWCINHGKDPMVSVDTALQIEGWKEPITISKEMADAVLVYVQYVKNQSIGAAVSKTEIRLQMPGHSDFWGTADCLIIHDFGVLEIPDFKFGVGIDVWPEDNYQVAGYLLGGLRYARDNDLTITSLRGTIIQPRVHTWSGPRVWEIDDVEAFEAKWAKKFEDAIVACLSKDPGRVVGDHCTFCLAKLECPELKDKLVLAAIEEFKETPVATIKPDQIKDIIFSAELEELVRIHSHAGIVRKFLDETAKYLKARADAGEKIPGYKLVESIGNRCWKLSDEEMVKKFRNKKLKQGDFYELKLKGPAKIEKIMLDPKFFEKYVTRPVKGTALAPESDMRPEVITNAIEEFAE